jgi:hypothetical protein
MRKAVNQKYKVYCSVLYAVVATFCIAAIKVCFHDVSPMYLCVESAYRVEGGAAGQHTGHTLCPHPINCYTITRETGVILWLKLSNEHVLFLPVKADEITLGPRSIVSEADPW